VIVVDDHITGVSPSTRPGASSTCRRRRARARAAIDARRYFKSPSPASAGAAPTSTDPLAIIEKIDPRKAWPGMRLLMVSTTGEDAEWFVLDETKPPSAADARPIRTVVERIVENCEPALCTVLFMGGAAAACARASPKTRCG
jgi:hypothetical protein